MVYLTSLLIVGLIVTIICGIYTVLMDSTLLSVMWNGCALIWMIISAITLSLEE
jgi:hypothetical protein